MVNLKKEKMGIFDKLSEDLEQRKRKSENLHDPSIISLKGHIQDLASEVAEIKMQIQEELANFKLNDEEYKKNVIEVNSKIIEILSELSNEKSKIKSYLPVVITDKINKLASRVSVILEPYFDLDTPKDMTERTFIEQAFINNNFSDLNEDEKEQKYNLINNLVSQYENSKPYQIKERKPLINFLSNQCEEGKVNQILMSRDAFIGFRHYILNGELNK